MPCLSHPSMVQSHCLVQHLKLEYRFPSGTNIKHNPNPCENGGGGVGCSLDRRWSTLPMERTVGTAS